MIAALARLLLAFQLLSLGAFTALLHALGLAPLPALAGAALSVSILRVAIVLNNFLLAGALRQPLSDGSRPRLPALALLMLKELRASAYCWYWALPFAKVGQQVFPASAAPPVLLVHGYGANAGFWTATSKALRAAGISHAAVDLEPVMADIDSYAERLEQAVGALCRASGHERVVLVGHSMGGLAIRAWLRRHGGARLARAVTLGTPHFGSELASYGFGKNARQMSIPNEWLATLCASEGPQVRSLFSCIWSAHDNIVAPQSSARLPGASDLRFDLVGHVALAFDPRVLQEVVSQIRQASSAG